jgi:hypothetical protein
VRPHNDQLTRVVRLGRMSQKEGDQLYDQGGSGLSAVQDLKGDDTLSDLHSEFREVAGVIQARRNLVAGQIGEFSDNLVGALAGSQVS